MDMRFARREVRRAQAVPLAYPQLVAALAPQQALSPTARIEARLARAAPSLDRVDALVRVLRGEDDWAGAATALRGSFHPAAATVRPGNRP